MRSCAVRDVLVLPLGVTTPGGFKTKRYEELATFLQMKIKLGVPSPSESPLQLPSLRPAIMSIDNRVFLYFYLQSFQR